MSSIPETRTRLANLRAVICAITMLAAVSLAPSALAARGPSAPRLQSPLNNASGQSLPAFQWGSVAGAATYLFQLAADRRFGALVASYKTHNTAASPDKALPDGVYFWRVRPINAKDQAGPWSPVRRFVKSWTVSPQLLGPGAGTLSWPAQPLVFRWSQVPHAVKYMLVVATDPSLGNQVIGSALNPTLTQGTVFTPSAPLSQGTYYWAVTPIDAEGHKGRRSAIASFSYVWPTATATNVTDLNPDSRVFDPFFSWNPVPGAARYEVEVNSAADFPLGSKWCCSGTSLGTSTAPLRVLANNAYYWRVRAIDNHGNAGMWNVGQSFTKQFDNITPTIANLRVVKSDDSAVVNSGAAPVGTDTPIVTWDPVPGASRYEVQLAPYSVLGCDWSLVTEPAYHAETAATAWTPLGRAAHIGPTAWPYPQTAQSIVPGAAYCLRVLARSDDDGQGGQVVSDWTQLNGVGQPAFNYLPPPAAGSPAPNLPMPASSYILPTSGTVTPRTPFFTWQRVSGAQGYFVVIARDQYFTDVADVGYTNVPAYAPRLANDEPLRDETTSYYWAVLPTTGGDGSGEFSAWQQDSPQPFQKSSVPPTQLAPADGVTISTEPTFMWSSAENARNYTVQVSADPSFGNPIDNVTTDATAYSSNSTYPADTRLYWRVRADDWVGHGLNWSATRTFVRTLPIPTPSPANATAGEQIPLLNWSSVQGATGYDIHVDKVDGTTANFNLAAAAFTPVAWYGVGVWRWEVRADFPTSTFGTTTSGYSAPQTFVRLLAAPTGAHGVKTASRLLLWWNPDPAARQYEVDIATSDGFSTIVDTHRTDNTSWAPLLDLKTPQTRGRLYWRIAAIDGIYNIGTFATGSFGKNPPAPKPPVKSKKKKKK